MRKGFTLIELMIVIAIIAIIAAIAIPNLLESRVTANEAAASSSLKSGVFPGEVQFQGGGYQDMDADNVGEYGTLGALGGLEATNKMPASTLKLLQGPLATGAAGATTRSANGYKFTSWVSGLTTTATGATVATFDEGTDPMATATAPTAATQDYNNGEKYWVVACVPDKFGDTGRRPFMITNDGQVRSPSTATSTNFWMTGSATAPTNSTIPTLTTMQAGLGNMIIQTYAETMNLGTTFATSYPVYSR